MPLQNCAECPLKTHHGKKVKAFKGRSLIGDAPYREVPYKGPTSGVDILIVGEGPSAHDVHAGKPFTGETGEAVERELAANGLNPSRIFYANACRCLLEKKDKTSAKTLKQILACCRPALEKAVAVLRPKLIVCFGDVALQQVLKQKGITGKRGKLVRSEEFGCHVFPTFHPAVCFMDQSKFALWKPDMAAIAAFARSGFHLDETASLGAYQDVESIRFLLDKQDYTAGFDTETQGKDWCDPNSLVISYSISDQEGSGYNVWLYRECDESEADRSIRWPRKTGKKAELTDVFVKRVGDVDAKITELREFCGRPDIKKVMMQGNYDLHRLRQLGIERHEVVSYTMDIQSAAHALDPDNFVKASMLQVQSAYLPGKPDHKTAFAAEVDKGDMLAAARENPERHTHYSAGDTDVTLCCANVLRSRLMQDKLLANYYVNLAHPVQSTVLYEIEKNGILFDRAKLPETKEMVASTLREKEREFLDLVPDAVRDKHREKGLKLTRGDFIRDVFFSKAGFSLPVLAKTPSGDPTTDRKVLIRLRDELDDCEAKEALSTLIEWGPYQKLYSTYLKGFEAALKPDGRLHTQITKTGTATGRTSSSNPNLQNIPKRNPLIMAAIRSMLIAPPGNVLVAVDYSQSELRWIAHESGDPAMVRIFKSGGDMHTITGMDMAKKRGHAWDSMDEKLRKKFRQDAKPVNFGFPYGQSAKGFQAYARDQYGVHFSLDEAELYRHTFLYESYAGLIPWHERRKAEALKNGLVRSAYGFIRRVPDITNPDRFRQGEAERIAINTSIQSASNDSTLLGALEARRSEVIDDRRAKLVLFVHDELVFEVNEDYLADFVPRLIGHLEHLPTERFGFTMRVPLVAEAKVGMDLANMTDFSAE